MEEWMLFACKHYAIFHKGHEKPGMVGDSYYPNIWEVEATGSQIPGYIIKLNLKQKKGGGGIA